jgi:hypothetical protein
MSGKRGAGIAAAASCDGSVGQGAGADAATPIWRNTCVLRAL